jgi:hypothetical protein
MKNIYIFILFFSASAVFSQNQLLADFEDAGTSLIFETWGSGDDAHTTTVVDNPFPGGINTTAKVSKHTVGNDGGRIAQAPGYTQYFNLTDNTSVTLKLYTSKAIDVKVKFEGTDYGPNNAEKRTTVSTLNQWVEVTIDFSGTTNILLNKVGIGFEGASGGDTFYVDDLMVGSFYTTNQLIYNPANGATGFERSDNIIITTNEKLTKTDGTALADGDISSIVSLKETDVNGADVAFTGTVSEWNNNTDEYSTTITVDPTDNLNFSSNYYVSINESSVKYQDDTAVLASSATFTTKAPVTNKMLIDFETPQTDAGWGSWGGAGFAKIDNPDPSGINTSAKVGKYTVPGGDAGIENNDVDGAKLPFFDYEQTPFFRVKVWVSKPVKVYMQLQNNPDWGNNTGVKEILVEETNKWVELVYNFGGTTIGPGKDPHNRIQIYFDRDKSGGSSEGDVYYFDEIHKSDVQPPASFTLNPLNAGSDIATYSRLFLTSNIAFKNADGSAITTPASNVALREGNANGTAVPTRVSITKDNLTFNIVPDAMLTASTTYWYGVIDGTTSTDDGNVVAGLSGTFTTAATSPAIAMYQDNEGGADSITIQDYISDDPYTTAIVVDPSDSNNSALQVDKSTSNWGWSSLHYELDNPIDFSKGTVLSFKIKSADASKAWGWTRLKIANQKEDGGSSKETDDSQFLANDEWQTVYFNFDFGTDPLPTDYTHIRLFLNPGNTDAGQSYLVDDLSGPALGTTASIIDISVQNFAFYPNPATSQLTFIGNVDGELAQVFDVLGRKQLSKAIVNNKLNVDKLDNGVYFLKVQGQVKKLIIK